MSRVSGLSISAAVRELSLALAKARAAAKITGIDISEDLVAAARMRAVGVPSVTFEVADAASLDVR